MSSMEYTIHIIYYIYPQLNYNSSNDKCLCSALATFRNQRDLISVNNRNNLVSSGYVAGSVRNSARSVGNLSRSNSRNNLNYNPATWFTNDEPVDGRHS